MVVNETAGCPRYASPISSHSHTLHFSWTRGPHSGDLFPSLPPGYMWPQDSVLATDMTGWRVRRGGAALGLPGPTSSRQEPRPAGPGREPGAGGPVGGPGGAGTLRLRTSDPKDLLGQSGPLPPLHVGHCHQAQPPPGLRTLAVAGELTGACRTSLSAVPFVCHRHWGDTGLHAEGTLGVNTGRSHKPVLTWG